MNIPSINVGRRQAGREKALSVFDFDLHTQNFATILQRALSARDRWNQDDEWPINPYYRHNTVELMVKHVEEFLETGRCDFGQA